MKKRFQTQLTFAVRFYQRYFHINPNEKTTTLCDRFLLLATFIPRLNHKLKSF